MPENGIKYGASPTEIAGDRPLPEGRQARMGNGNI